MSHTTSHSSRLSETSRSPVQNRDHSTRNIVIAAGAGVAGGILGGVPMTLSSLAIAAGVALFNRDHKMDSRRRPYTYKGRVVRFAGSLLLGAGTVSTIHQCHEILYRNTISIQQATDTAITRVTQGQTPASEPAAITGPTFFGNAIQTGTTTLTAEKIGTDGVCLSVRVTQDGEQPYIIAARPPDRKNGQYQPCTKAQTHDLD